VQYFQKKKKKKKKKTVVSAEPFSFQKSTGLSPDQKKKKCSKFKQQVLAQYTEDKINKAFYEGLSKSFRTGRVEREMQMVQLSSTRCSCIAILLVSLVSFAAITFCVASQRIIPKVSMYFVIDSVRKLVGTPSYAIEREGLLRTLASQIRRILVSRKVFCVSGLVPGNWPRPLHF
jgi:hypothetical protein